MDKGILVINQNNSLSSSNLFGNADQFIVFCRDNVLLSLTSDGINHGRSLQFGLKFFGWWTGIVQQSGTGTDFSDSILDTDGTESQSSIQTSIKSDQSNGTSIPAARGSFIVFHKLNGPSLGSSRDSHGPGVTQKGIQRIKFGSEVSLHVIDRVDQSTVHFNLTTANDLDGSWFANTGLVVTVDIGTHGQFTFFLLVHHKTLDTLGIFQSIGTTSDSSGNGTSLDTNGSRTVLIIGNAFATNKHFGTGTDQVFLFAQVDKESVRSWVALAQTTENPRRRSCLCQFGPKGLGQDRFKQVSNRKFTLGCFHAIGKVPSRSIPLGKASSILGFIKLGKGIRLTQSGQSLSRLLIDAKVIGDLPGIPLIGINHIDGIWQIQQNITLFRIPLLGQIDGFKGKGQIVSKGTIETQLPISVFVSKQVDKSTNDRKEGWLS
mmetsp:Transcript_30779/g.73881  ORF Transcript_30779/g.73881 Transcript_30779/m.73881 type:complete len:433 (-) Transcript_30779:950-2248(-)